MDKELILHGNAALTGGKSKRIIGVYQTNSTVKENGQDIDEEFSKNEVDNIKL
ncbi:MAG: hypothetical protein LBM87_01750 [Ruminococcus sp.]|jgi:hypothetical protein|nr:hypothetical protein [Ruminococcus sp.]